MALPVKVPTKIGPCYPRCAPTYGLGGGLGSRSHRLVNGVLPGAGPTANPWWDPADEGLCIWAAYQPKGAANLAASYLDLSGNGNNAGVGVAPTWDAVNGWIFNGATQYLTTSFVPQNDQSQSVLIQFTNGTTNNGSIFGVDDGVNRDFRIVPVGAGQVYYQNGNSVAAAGNHTDGNLTVAGNQGYRDGLADGGAIGAWGGAAVNPCWIGCKNTGGSPTFYFACRVQALAIYDCALTVPQVAVVYAAMAAL